MPKNFANTTSKLVPIPNWYRIYSSSKD